MQKTTFKTPYGEHPRVHAPSGSMMQDVYTYQIDKYGRKELQKTGETNLYETIQASLEETKIENILSRAMAGDVSAMRANGTYIDTTMIPNNIIEIKKAINNMENLWYGLDQETRNKYNNSMEEFVGASGTDKWLKDMGLIKDNTVVNINEGKAEPDQVEAFGEVGKDKVEAHE